MHVAQRSASLHDGVCVCPAIKYSRYIGTYIIRQTTAHTLAAGCMSPRRRGDDKYIYHYNTIPTTTCYTHELYKYMHLFIYLFILI